MSHRDRQIPKKSNDHLNNFSVDMYQQLQAIEDAEYQPKLKSSRSHAEIKERLQKIQKKYEQPMVMEDSEYPTPYAKMDEIIHD